MIVREELILFFLWKDDIQKMIEFKNVNKVYETGTEAVHNANFIINKGEFVFLVGATASRKIHTYKTYIKRRKSDIRKYNNKW